MIKKWLPFGLAFAFTLWWAAMLMAHLYFRVTTHDRSFTGLMAEIAFMGMMTVGCCVGVLTRPKR